MQQGTWQSYLPLVIIAIVFIIRARRINKERRLRLGSLLIGPVIVGALAIWMLASVPPDAIGAALFAGGLAIGAGLGWMRARLTAVSYNAASGQFSTVQSPWALLFLIAIIIAKRLLPATGPIDGHASLAVAQHAMQAIDGLMGFGLGMVASGNLQLWLRARQLRAAQGGTANAAG